MFTFFFGLFFQKRSIATSKSLCPSCVCNILLVDGSLIASLHILYLSEAMIVPSFFTMIEQIFWPGPSNEVGNLTLSIFSINTVSSIEKSSRVMNILDERDTLSVMVNSGAKATPVDVLQAIGCIGPSVNFYARNFAKTCKDVGVCVFGGDDSSIGGDVSCAWLSDNLWDGLRPVQQFIMSCSSIENMVRSIVCTGEGGY